MQYTRQISKALKAPEQLRKITGPQVKISKLQGNESVLANVNTKLLGVQLQNADILSKETESPHKF